VSGVRDREQLLRELRWHLGIPDHGGRAAITVVVDGLELTVEVTAELKLDGAARGELLKQAIAYFEAELWRLGPEAVCGVATTKRGWGHRSCSNRVCGAIAYRAGKEIRFQATCRTHGSGRHSGEIGFVTIPRHEIRRLAELSSADRARRWKEEDARRQREGLDRATGAPL
jgi:hypothetical protein